MGVELMLLPQARHVGVGFGCGVEQLCLSEKEGFEREQRIAVLAQEMERNPRARARVAKQVCSQSPAVDSRMAAMRSVLV